MPRRTSKHKQIAANASKSPSTGAIDKWQFLEEQGKEAFDLKPSRIDHAGPRRRCFVHVGTHKTGTTSLQNSLQLHAGRLRAADIYVPLAGRTGERAAHHNIAWELNGDDRFDPKYGSLSTLLAEIRTASQRTICLSSEDFEYLHDKPAALQRLRSGLNAAGCEVVVGVYLRPQVSYAESLYAELVKHGFCSSFDDYLDAIIRDGAIGLQRGWRFTFDYERLIDGFAQVFGSAALVIRPYTDRVSGSALIGDFFRVIGADAPAIGRERNRGGMRLNTSLPFGAVLRTLRENVALRDRGAALERPNFASERNDGSRFDPLHLSDVERFARRFAPGNARLYERYGVAIPYVSRRDLLHDLIAALGLNAPSIARLRRLRELGGGDGDSARRESARRQADVPLPIR